MKRKKKRPSMAYLQRWVYRMFGAVRVSIHVCTDGRVFLESYSILGARKP